MAISDNNNKVVTSSDCKIWNEVTLPTSLSYTSVIYSSKLHKICIVAKNTNQLLISDDGNVFTTVTLPSLLDYVDVVAIDNIDSATGGMFIAISTGTTIVVSTNGTDWVEKTIPAPVNNGTWNAITYNDTSKQLVIVGSNGSILMSNSNITSNVDSIVFTSKNLSSNTVNLSDVCYSSVFGKYCAVVSNNSNKAYTYDIGNDTWNEVALSSSSNWIKVIYVPFYRAFFALSGSENKCAVSLDGITWKDINLPNTGSSTSKYSSVACSEQLNCMCMTIDGANKFVVVGIDVPFVLSTIRWEEHTLPSSTYWHSICWSPELRLFCTVAYNNKAATSPDGITWTERTLPSSTDWYSICWSPELRLFCIVAYGSNKAVTSPDGITWTERTLPSITNSWINICWSPELRLFCAIAYSSNKAATSPDGITWTERTLLSSDSWQSISWSSELQQFCAIAYNSNKSVLGIPE